MIEHLKTCEERFYECPRWCLKQCNDGQKYTKADLITHLKNDCPRMLVVCKICKDTP